MNARAHVRYAYQHGNPAIGFDGDRGAGTACARGPLVDRHAAADVFRLGLFPAGRRNGFLERFVGENVLQLLAERRRVTVVKKILPAKGHRIHAQFPRDDVDLRFHGKNHLRASRRARLRARHLIGVGAQRFNLNRGNPIVACHAPRSLNCHLGIRFQRRIGAAAENHLGLERAKPAVTSDAGAQGDHDKVAIQRGRQVLGIVEHQFDRLARAFRQKVADRSFDDRSLAAEVPAHRQNVHSDVFRVEI